MPQAVSSSPGSEVKYALDENIAICIIHPNSTEVSARLLGSKWTNAIQGSCSNHCGLDTGVT